MPAPKKTSLTGLNEKFLYPEALTRTRNRLLPYMYVHPNILNGKYKKLIEAVRRGEQAFRWADRSLTPNIAGFYKDVQDTLRYDQTMLTYRNSNRLVPNVETLIALARQKNNMMFKNITLTNLHEQLVKEYNHVKKSKTEQQRVHHVLRVHELLTRIKHIGNAFRMLDTTNKKKLDNEIQRRKNNKNANAYFAQLKNRRLLGLPTFKASTTTKKQPLLWNNGYIARAGVPSLHPSVRRSTYTKGTRCKNNYNGYNLRFPTRWTNNPLLTGS